MNEVRIDKWLWAVRLFKTRTIAARACKKNRISVGGVNTKPSHVIKIGDVVNLRKPPVTYSFKVLDIPDSRIGAKLLSQYLENVTSPEQYELLKMRKISGFIDRSKGLGRPTKRHRRHLDEFILFDEDDNFISSYDFDDDDL